MDGFEEMLRENLPVLQRFINFRVSHRFDAEDLLQETCAAAAAIRHIPKKPIQSFVCFMVAPCVRLAAAWGTKKRVLESMPSPKVVPRTRLMHMGERAG